MQEKILVTGVGGYIGSITAYELLKQDFEIVAIDNFSTGYKGACDFLGSLYSQHQFRWYEEHVSNSAAVFEKERGINAVIHFAGSTIVDESMTYPENYFANNTCASTRLLESIRQHDIPIILFSSTAAVYGETQKGLVHESHPVNPENPYGHSKYMTEKIIRWYEQVGIRHGILRYFNVCGASDDGMLGNAQQPSYALVHNAVKGALGIEPFKLTCSHVNTPDGSPIRDYINIVDLADAHIRTLKYLLTGGSSTTINIGTQSGYSVLEIVNAIEKVTGTSIRLEPGTPRKGECASVVASFEKARETVGWQPRHTLEQSITSTVHWLTKHPRGWES